MRRLAALVPLAPRARVWVEGSDAEVALLAGVLATGLLLGFHVVWRLVADRAARAATAAAQADRRRFLVRLDHELKNPITAMRRS